MAYPGDIQERRLDVWSGCHKYLGDFLTLLPFPACTPEPSTCGTNNCALKIPTMCARVPSWYTTKGPSIGSP
eukprot:12889986-Prorocentrum_lima.AAC.1